MLCETIRSANKKRGNCNKLSLFYLQCPDAGASSFVIKVRANAAPSLRLGVVEPSESSPDLAGVVLARCQHGIAGVVEGAREELVVMTRQNLSAKAVVGLFVLMPKSRCFICKKIIFHS